MRSTSLFTNGGSQAVRLPKEYRIDGTDVYITKHDGVIMLLPKGDAWKTLRASLDEFTDDFMEHRGQRRPQTRNS